MATPLSSYNNSNKCPLQLILIKDTTHLTNIGTGRVARHNKGTGRLNDLAFGNARCHAQRVLSTVYSHAELPHHVAHGCTGVVQGGTLARQFGSPHPVTTAFNVLHHRRNNEFNVLTH